MFALLLAAHATAADPPHFDSLHDKIPYEAAWGPYRIRVDYNDASGARRLVIRDHGGKIVREVRDKIIESVDTVNLTGERSPCLRVTTACGDVDRGPCEIYFSGRNRIRNILIFKGEQVAVQTPTRGDKRPIVTFRDTVMDEFSEQYFVRAAALYTSVQWNGVRFVDVTRRHPEHTLAWAHKLETGIVEVLGESGYHDWEVHDRIAGYYANISAIGRERAADAWLRKHVPFRMRRWLARNKPELRRIARTAAIRRSRVSSKKIIQETAWEEKP